MVIVPNELQEQIDSALTRAFQRARVLPEAVSVSDRDALYQQLLAFYDERGFVPEFEIKGPVL